MADVLPIYANTDVHGFYNKQKSEFHFQQKTDNEFLMFLLDTAVRVISIVQHLAPVIEAVSDASADNDEEEEFDEQEFTSQGQLTGTNSSVMEVDNLANAVLKDVPIAPPAKVWDPEPSISDQLIAQQVQQLIDAPTSLPSLQQYAPMIQKQQQQSMIQQSIPQYQPEAYQIEAPPSQLAPNVSLSNPSLQRAQRSQPLPQTSTRPSPQNRSQPSPQTSDTIKEEKPIPEVIEIKEEPEPSSSVSSLLTPKCIQQLMNSVQNNEENVRIQNFVPTAQPSNLPPSFLDKNSPLSMLSLSVPGLDNVAGGSGLQAKDDKSIDSKGNASNPSRPRFFSGSRGGSQCSHLGFTYSKEKSLYDGVNVSWQCKDKKLYDPWCRGRLYTIDGRVVRQGSHNHANRHSRQQCPYCEKTCASKQSLKQHMLHHQQNLLGIKYINQRNLKP